MGKVNMMIDGLIKIFNKLNTIATKKEVVILATNTPGSSCAMIKTKMVVTMIFNKSFIFSLIKRKYILDKNGNWVKSQSFKNDIPIYQRERNIQYYLNYWLRK